MNTPAALRAEPAFSLSRIMPRHLGLLVALLCAGGVLASGIARETPHGRLQGRVTLAESQKPLAHARITLTPIDEDNQGGQEFTAESDPARRYGAVTDEKGEFELSRVVTGRYAISGASRSHRVDETEIRIVEDETTDVKLVLRRSLPDLQLSQRQQSFLTSEAVTLPVHGYIDGKRPAGQDSVQIRVFRTRLSDVLKDPKATTAMGRVLQDYRFVPALPRELLHPAETLAPRLIMTEISPISDADIEGLFHKRLKLRLPGAGLYLVDITHGDDRVCGVVSISDMGLIVKKSKDGLLAYAVDSRSGAPKPGAEIQVFRAGAAIARARADGQGLARITVPAPGAGVSGGNLLTLAIHGDNEARVGQYDGGAQNEGRGLFAAHAYTDRPIYRPGDLVSYKGILRRTLDTGIRYAVPANEPVDIEIRDDDGGRVAKTSLKTNSYGSFHGTVALSPEAPTGTYSIVMTVRGEEHTSDFTVASYRKPEFTATVTPGARHYCFNDKVEMAVDASYYFGAPVAGAKVRYTILREPDWRSYFADEETRSDEEEESFDPEGEGYGEGGSEIVDEGEAALDENGHVVISFIATRELPKKEDESEDEGEKEESDFGEPEDQNYSVRVSITDSAEREIEAGGTVPVTSGDFRLSLQTEGYFAVPRRETSITVTARDFDGRAVANAPVSLSGFYRKWNPDGKKTEEIAIPGHDATTGSKGVARIAITPDREGVLYLQVRANDKAGRTISAKRDLWVSGRDGGDYDAQYSALSLLTDKKRYKNGETARVLVNTEHSGGTALLTVEGSKLFRAWLVPLKHRSTALQVPIAADYGPNVTLAACLVRDKKLARSEVPLRVDVPQREIQVTVRADNAKYRPGDKVTYDIRAADSKGRPVACELSFGVVDEAIYALREDDPAALRRAFYPRNSNNVSTSYSFEPLYLGDVNKADPQIEARRKFVDTAFWKPDLQTDSAGHARVSFALPDNLTAWRATAVAQTLQTAFGRRTQKVVVAKDFFVRLEAPRFFTAGDHSQLQALVHNETGQLQNATVRMEGAGFSLGEGDTRTLQIAPGSVGQVVWPLTLNGTPSGYSREARFKLSAWTDSGDGAQYTDAVEQTIPIRPHGSQKLENFVGSLDDAKAVDHSLTVDPGAVPDASRVTVRIMPSITDALVGPVRYLVGYPYGCTEQTMSRILPDILVQRTLQLRGAKDKEAQRLAKELPIMVRDGLTRLARYQHYTGGWGWWEHDDDDPWMTAYVLYGLARARNAGYEVDREMLESGRRAAQNMIRRKFSDVPKWEIYNWTNTRAFLRYAVARTEVPMPGIASYVDTTTSGSESMGSQALAYNSLLNSWRNSILDDRSFAALEKRLATGAGGMMYWKGSGNEDWWDWNDKTATAAGLQALVVRNPQDPRIPRILLWLMTRREDDSWGSTRDTSWVLDALCTYLDRTRIRAGSVPGAAGAVTVKLNGAQIAGYNLSTSASAGEIVLQIPWAKLKSGANQLTLQRSGSGEPVFYTVQVQQTVASEQIMPATYSTVPIGITREYRRVVARAAGNNDWTLQSEATGDQLNQGDRIRVRLTFDVPRPLSYVLIEDAFPSGCEVTERGTAGESSEDWNNWWSNTDVRDDRIAFFARHLGKGRHVIEYNLRAQTAGAYNALPAVLQAMYAPEVRAQSAESRVTIR